MKNNYLKLCVIGFIIVIYSCNQNEAVEKGARLEKKETKEAKTKDSLKYFKYIDLSSDPNDEDFDGAEGLVESEEMSKIPKVIEDGKLYYVIEGDLLMSGNEYLLYKNKKDSLSTISSNFINVPFLLGYIRDNQIVKQTEHLNLKYAIIKASFKKNLKEYELVKKNMKQAAKEWEKLCNVKFNYLENLDEILTVDDNPEILTFVIKKKKTTKYTAAAFFPHEPKEKRKLRISPKYFLSSYDKIGILRHEIGHILGFLHEHIRIQSPNCYETTTEVMNQNTKYDPKSVMHYFCKGIGDKELRFTDLDRAGAQEYYPFN